MKAIFSSLWEIQLFISKLFSRFHFNLSYNKFLSKNLFFMLLICANYQAQSGFEFERSWGTYFGANGGQISGINTTRGILFDSQKNLNIRGTLWNQQNTPASYYNQFLIGGGSPYIIQQGLSSFQATFSQAGSLSYYGYINPVNFANLEKIDQSDNRYYIIRGSALSVQPTPGAYFTTDPNPSSANKVMLAKYSPSGVLLWATYLPNAFGNVNIELDPAGNAYVYGETRMVQNISTAGVLQENFDLIYDSYGDLIPSGYILKFSPGGQRLWGTYMPSGASYSMQYFDDALYIITGKNTNATLNTMATVGAYQSSVADASLTKINTLNGTREWGTYYGPPSGSSMVLMYDLAVNETGLYVTGTDYNFDGSSFFGTPTSYKQTVTGGSDLFLSKFTLSGNRVWSTYFGSSGEDMNEFDKVIAVAGNDVFITGLSYGATNNIATPNSYQSAPEFNSAGSNNFYFAKFDSSGSLSWASYYGGTNNSAGITIPINVGVDDGNLYLYGSTNSNVGYATEGAWMPVRNPNNTNQLTGFMAKFINKNLLGVSDNTKNSDLVLYDNPNNGEFSIKGKILTVKKCEMQLYDVAGRQILVKKMSNDETQKFDLKSVLQKGNYVIKISESKSIIKTFKMTVK